MFMNTPTDPAPSSSPLRARAVNVCLAVAVLALVPHLAKSYDISDGLRLGINATTNTASNSSLMLGQNNYNPGNNSIGIGWGNSVGGSNAQGNIAAGLMNTVTGYASFGFGSNNQTPGSYSMAIGSGNIASGSNSLAHGSSNQATGSGSNAGGGTTVASGQFSTTRGYYTTAPSYASVAIGRYNFAPTGQSATSWVASDQIFVIGNGTGPSVYDRSNLLEVKKNGTIIIKRQGDILMTGFEAQ